MESEIAKATPNPRLVECRKLFEQDPNLCFDYIDNWEKDTGSDIESVCARGAFLSRLGRYKEALDAHLEASAKAPDNPILHFNLSCVYNKTEDYSRAMAEIEIALSLKADPHFTLQRGLIILNLGQLNEAIAVFDELIDSKQLLNASIFYRGSAEMVRGNIESALRDLNNTTYEVNSGGLFLRRGYCLSSLGNYESARDNLLKALELAPNKSDTSSKTAPDKSDVCVEIARNEFRQENYTSAILFCNTAIDKGASLEYVEGLKKEFGQDS